MRDGDTWVLSGKKHWITGGGVSQLYLIFARVIEGGEFNGIGGFISYLGEGGLMIGARGYSRNSPVERMLRDARMFTIGGGTAQMLRNLVAGRALNMKTPQIRDGYLVKDVNG
ncbi:acyl-CoA dehydrogenase family protein [Ruegeria sp.]|uniref:acyl-CoA dehydrogenase family protein n=1 Tax=Ruegeria sp. TaxID=1879320 RepID=UPI00231C680F|nr:acyl-CoA dehydrogenase family protein [Ruegeria sp.]MDA7965342.1 hypothetical protein [Ruegeria sp.]